MLAGQMVKAQAEKGILWSFAAEEGFCFVTAALLSAVTVLKVRASGSCAFCSCHSAIQPLTPSSPPQHPTATS